MAGGCGGGSDDSPAPGPGLRQVGEFREPLFVAQPPGAPGLLLVVEKAGVIRAVRGSRKLRRPFLDIRGRVRHKGTEQGLLSVAFPPDYQRSRRLYIAFIGRAGTLRVQELRRSRRAQAVALRKPRNLLAIPQLSATHNGGLLLFGPDGYLYLGAGDGGLVGDPKDNAQNRNTLRGKILRIDPRRRGGRPYTTPRSNPFHGRPGRNEIYAIGLRNPWRFSFDRATGALAIGDVGQDTFEEVDYVPPGQGLGANFGWAAFEGHTRFKRKLRVRHPVEPVVTYRQHPRCAVTGGYVVRDPALYTLDGRYLYGDYCTGELFSFRPEDPVRSNRRLGLRVPRLSSFGEDSRGHVYLVSLKGPVYWLVQLPAQ
ncbi:MAG: PQQ-dependent sugar dehydrogenase [Actinomycetota bacterium]